MTQPAEVDNRYSSMSCQCGETFQVLRDTVTPDGRPAVEFDEQATADALNGHVERH